MIYCSSPQARAPANARWPLHWRLSAAFRKLIRPGLKHNCWKRNPGVSQVPADLQPYESAQVPTAIKKSFGLLWTDGPEPFNGPAQALIDPTMGARTGFLMCGFGWYRLKSVWICRNAKCPLAGQAARVVSMLIKPNRRCRFCTTLLA